MSVMHNSVMWTQTQPKMISWRYIVFEYYTNIIHVFLLQNAVCLLDTPQSDPYLFCFVGTVINAEHVLMNTQTCVKDTDVHLLGKVSKESNNSLIDTCVCVVQPKYYCETVVDF